VLTTNYGDGPKTLKLHGVDATGYGVDYSHTVRIDNRQPTVSISGPADAPSTAGPQYVTATGSAGPSGVAGVACAVDGAPYEWRNGGSGTFPIQGIGQHHISCLAENNAVDQGGNRGRAAVQARTMSIR